MILPFKLPTPTGFLDPPKWNGFNFVFDDQCTPVLEYSENFAGWSDDLTALHEKVAGDKHPIDLASRHDALLQVKHVMPSADAVIMEIGCSSGFLISDMTKYFPEAVILGVDVVKSPLFRLAKSLPGIPLMRFDLLQCPLPDKSVDVLVMLNVLEHIDDDVKALQKAYNLLKPGGSLVLEVPAGPSLYDSYDLKWHHFRRYSVSELRKKLSITGFIIYRKSHLGFLMFPAFFISKLLNRMISIRTKRDVVQEKAVQASGIGLVRFAMNIESKYLSEISLPFGIRMLVTARKPL